MRAGTESQLVRTYETFRGSPDLDHGAVEPLGNVNGEHGLRYLCEAVEEEGADAVEVDGRVVRVRGVEEHAARGSGRSSLQDTTKSEYRLRGRADVNVRLGLERRGRGGCPMR